MLSLVEINDIYVYFVFLSCTIHRPSSFVRFHLYVKKILLLFVVLGFFCFFIEIASNTCVSMCVYVMYLRTANRSGGLYSHRDSCTSKNTNMLYLNHILYSKNMQIIFFKIGVLLLLFVMASQYHSFIHLLALLLKT